MLSTEQLRSAFSKGLSYSEYVAKGNPSHQERWKTVYEAVSLKPKQKELLADFKRDMKVLVLSGVWCGDCMAECPPLVKIAEACDRLELRFLERDEHPEIRDALSLNAGQRVPVTLFLAEDDVFCGIQGDRSLSRYRSMAVKYLGPACPTGVEAPASNEIEATVQDWMDQVERIQLMLLLSPRLHALHQE